MNDWFNVLKVQILDTTTDLDINMEPMTEDKDEDCCENAVYQFKQMEDDIKNYHKDLLTHSSELKDIDGFRLVVTSLGLHSSYGAYGFKEGYGYGKFLNSEDYDCQNFYSYLAVFWGRLGILLINLPTTIKNLWKRGHEIKKQLHEIMKELEECDDKLWIGRDV